MGGSADRFRDLYHEFKGPIFAFLRRSSGDEQLAMDLVQDVFLNFIRVFQGKDLPDRDRCRMYLFRAARNVLINYYKSYYNRRVHPHDDPEKLVPSDSRSAVESRFIAEDTRAQSLRTFEALLSRLNDTERNALLLRYEHDMTIEQVAEVMELSTTTAFRLIKKARQDLVREGQRLGFRPLELAE